MPNTQLHDLARMGARSRLAGLDQERDEILKMFPELRNGAGRGGATKGRKDHMSPEARKRQAERMRAYWAERRAKRAGTKGAKKSSAKAKRGGMSAGARQAQAERMKAYWAAKRAEKQAGGGAPAQAARATNGSSTSQNAGRKAGPRKQRKS